MMTSVFHTRLRHQINADSNSLSSIPWLSILEEHECVHTVKGLQDPYSIWGKVYGGEKQKLPSMIHVRYFLSDKVRCLCLIYVILKEGICNLFCLLNSFQVRNLHHYNATFKTHPKVNITEKGNEVGVPSQTLTELWCIEHIIRHFNSLLWPGRSLMRM